VSSPVLLTVGNIVPKTGSCTTLPVSAKPVLAVKPIININMAVGKSRAQSHKRRCPFETCRFMIVPFLLFIIERSGRGLSAWPYKKLRDLGILALQTRSKQDRPELQNCPFFCPRLSCPHNSSKNKPMSRLIKGFFGDLFMRFKKSGEQFAESTPTSYAPAIIKLLIVIVI
jgi:hypothetical protein